MALAVLAAEMGDSNAVYICQTDVQITPTLTVGKNPKIKGTFHKGDRVQALEQGFTRDGTARIRTDMGWCDYCVGGLTGVRLFKVLEHQKTQSTGRVHVQVERLARIVELGAESNSARSS
eukprot:COSAG05_NODE_13944_length_413_cov_0.815287_1_plen_119_part_10